VRLRLQMMGLLPLLQPLQLLPLIESVKQSRSDSSGWVCFPNG
jgi:hypothetical protein